MLLGVVLERVAIPPVNEKTKSPTARFPLPELVANTLSENVTANVLLSDARETPVIVGTTFPFKLTVLLLCVVVPTLPLASYMALVTGTTLSTSFPSGVPERLSPKV